MADIDWVKLALWTRAYVDTGGKSRHMEEYGLPALTPDEEKMFEEMQEHFGLEELDYFLDEAVAEKLRRTFKRYGGEWKLKPGPKDWGRREAGD
jgi:hypothetical protein